MVKLSLYQSYNSKANSNHIKFGIIVLTTNDTKVVATSVKDNKLLNNFTILNTNIKKNNNRLK